MAIIITDELITDVLSSDVSVTDKLEDKYKDELISRRASDKRCENLDAFQFALIDAGITKKSKIKDMSNKNDWLFPAFVDKRLGESVFKNEILSEICSNVITVDSTVVKSQTVDLINDEDNKKAVKKTRVAEGADLPVANIHTSGEATFLYKRGRAVRGTYEEIQTMTVDMFSKTIDYIANDVAGDEIKDAIDVLCSIGTAQKWNTDETELTSKRLIEFALDYYVKSGIPLSTIIVPRSAFITMNEMFVKSNDVAGATPTAKFNMPQGILGNLTILYADVPQESGKDQIIGIHKDYSLTKYVANGLLIREIDTNIRNQTKLGTISEVSGFAKFIENATLRMKQSAT